MTDLSIITVTLNAVNSIEDTISSVLNQSYKSYEYIVIDGGSTDGTIELINKFKDRITFFLSEQDTGIYNAINKGLKYCKGNYIYTLNSGDVLFNQYSLENIFKLNPDSEIVYGDICYRLNNNLIYRNKSPNKISKFFLLSDSIPHPATLIKRELLERNDNYDESYKIAGDYEFSLRSILKYKCKTQYIPLPIAIFNLKGISSDKQNKLIVKNERKKAQIRYFSTSTLEFYRIIKPFYVLFFKKFRYLWNFVFSRVKNTD